MKTYQEYLAETGASPEDIAILATPKAIAAYNKIQADAATAQSAALEAAKAEHDATTQNWWNTEYQPGLESRDADILRLSGENARIKATLVEAKRLGLTQVAIDAGHEPDNAAAVAAAARAASANNPNFDPKKFVAAEDFQTAYKSTGKAIAQATSIVAEHFAMFGTMPGDMEDMLEAAQQSGGKKTLRAVWEEKYKVSAKREEIAATKQKEHDDRIRAEERAKVIQETGINPNLAVARTSRNSFTSRPAEKEGKKFFEIDQNSLQKNRVSKFAGKVQ